MRLARLRVEARLVLQHCAVRGHEHVDLRVVAELVIAAHAPERLAVLHELQLAERRGQLEAAQLPVRGRLLARVPVQALPGVQRLALDVQAAADLELNFALLLPHADAEVLARYVQRKALLALALGDVIHLALRRAALLVVLAAHDQDLLAQLVLVHLCECALEL